MEWLNSVWNLLTTENEFVTNILLAPSSFIEAWLLFKISTSILQIHTNQKQKIIYIVLLGFNSILTEFLIKNPYNVLANYLIMLIIIKSVLHTNKVNTLLSLILPTAIFALINILILKPLLLIFELTSKEALHIPLYQLLYNSFLYIFVYFSIKLVNYRKVYITFKENFSKHNKKIIFLNLIFGFFTICIQLTITAFYTDILPIYLTFLSFISLLAYFFISIFSLTRIVKLQITTRNLENAEQYNNTLSFLYDNVKAFKHDFDNIVFTIGGFINTNDMSGLKKYYESLEKDCERVNNIALLNPQLINNAGIYNLLTAKYQKALANNVEIQLDFFFDLEKLHMPVYEFSRILGILIDNAIEAASTTTNKIVKITFRDTPNANTQIIKIKNTFNNLNIDTNKIFEKGFTDKKNHSGIGLWEVKQILKRNNNIKLLTSSDNNNFTQTLEIYY